MDVLRGLEPLPTAYRRQALAEAVPGVMPQVAHLAMENGRSSKGDMTLWLEAHRPKMGKLEGDPEIEREALANLETSDVFRAVTAPLRLGGGRQGELMLDEFRRGAARYGMLRNDPMAGVRFLEENVRTLQSEGLAEIYWPTDKTMPVDLEGRLRDAKGEIVNAYQDNSPEGIIVDDLVVRPDDPKPGIANAIAESPPIETQGEDLTQSIWVNSTDGRGFVLIGQDGNPMTGSDGSPFVFDRGKRSRDSSGSRGRVSTISLPTQTETGATPAARPPEATQTREVRLPRNRSRELKRTRNPAMTNRTRIAWSNCTATVLPSRFRRPTEKKAKTRKCGLEMVSTTGIMWRGGTA